MNKQQELLYEVLHRKSSEMLACLHRKKEADNSITYGLVFFRKSGRQIVPEIGVRVQFMKELEGLKDDPVFTVLDCFFLSKIKVWNIGHARLRFLGGKYLKR